MHCVQEEVIIEKTVRADRVEQGLTVDEDTVMPRRHFAISVLELGHAAHRQAVEISRLDELLVRLVPAPAFSSRQPRR